ncbi:MAG: multidrug effflux MFS transporter [Lysobacterales bacterium]
MTNAEQKIPSVWLLGIASSLSPFGMAIVVPALASIADHFSADFLSVQFVVSAYLLGLAVSQPACGFLCDRYGRRPVMLIGFVVFIGASVLCVLAPTLEFLIVARFIQAAGVSVGTVASRAILRDTRSGDQVAVGMSLIAAIMGLAPVVAPILGGLLDATLGYRWIFATTTVMGLVVFLGMFSRMNETLNRNHGLPRWRDWFGSYGLLLTSPSFVGYTMVFGFVQGSFFAFMAVGAPYFASEYAISSSKFGVLWGSLAIAYVAGASIGARLTRIIGTHRVVRYGVCIGLIAGIAFPLASSASEPELLQLLLPMALLMVISGATTPGAMAGAIAAHPDMAGTAAGLSSALGLLIAGSFTVMAGAVYTGGFFPVALLMFGACTATALSCWLAQRAEFQPA